MCVCWSNLLCKSGGFISENLPWLEFMAQTSSALVISFFWDSESISLCSERLKRAFSKGEVAESAGHGEKSKENQ